MIELTDFSEIKCGAVSENIGATTIINSNKAVRKNLGIYKSGEILRTGRYCGIAWQRNKEGAIILDDKGKMQPLVIKPRFGLNIDDMIHKIAEDDEFFEYLCYDQPEGDRMFTFFFDEEMMEVLPDDFGDNCIMVAMSFIHLLYQETRRTIMRKIVRKENNFIGKIKGKILFNKQVQKNIVQGHEERIYCGYVEKSEDIFENQILKYALIQAKEYLTSKRINNGQIAYEIMACIVRFANVSELESVDAEIIDMVQLTPIYSNFEQVMQLAYLVIAEISMTTNLKNDSNKIIPYAVNMPLLFECYCRTIIKENIKDCPDIKMLRFVANKFWDYDENEYGIRSIQGEYYISGKIVPDIILQKDKNYYVLDVKYKKFLWYEMKSDNEEEEKRYEISLPKSEDRREDRLQLLTYNEIYRPNFCGHIFPSSYILNGIYCVKKYIFGEEVSSISYYMFFLENENNKVSIRVKECIQNE